MDYNRLKNGIFKRARLLPDQQEKVFWVAIQNTEELQYICWSITTESSTLALHQDFPAEFQATTKQTQDKIQPATYLSNTLNTVFNTNKQLKWEARWCNGQCTDSGSRGSGSCPAGPMCFEVTGLTGHFDTKLFQYKSFRYKFIH